MSILSVILDLSFILLFASSLALTIRLRSGGIKVSFALLVIVGLLIMALVSVGRFVIILLGTVLLLATLVILLIAGLSRRM
jgi:hypothetical protein